MAVKVREREENYHRPVIANYEPSTVVGKGHRAPSFLWTGEAKQGDTVRTERYSNRSPGCHAGK